MKTTHKYLYTLFIAALSFTACDREIEQEIIDITPPELHVFIEDGSGSAVANATVNIYNTEENLNNSTDPVITKNADDEGKVIATGDELGGPGVFYLRAESGSQSGTGATPYLLLNDGHTRFEIIVQ